MIRANSNQRPLRVSGVIPARFPALDTSVQGNPPHTMSTWPRQGSPAKVDTSLQIGASHKDPSRILA
jgi:hypothetical protein